MKKKAFTLAEVLITLGVIGVVAAVTLPAVQKIFPDETKVKYMKAYNALTTLTTEMLENSSLYYTTYNSSYEPECSGLSCGDLSASKTAGLLEPKLLEIYNKQTSSSNLKNLKYAMILASQMHLQGDPTFSGTKTTFTTTDGIKWEITGDVSSTGKHTVVINVNPSDTNSKRNCKYGDSGCGTNPNKFEFSVAHNGSVSAVDKLGKAFLLNATDMHSADKDRSKASSL